MRCFLFFFCTGYVRRCKVAPEVLCLYGRGGFGVGIVEVGGDVLVTTLNLFDLDAVTRSTGPRRNFIFAAIGRGPVASVGGRGHSDAY